MVQYANTFVHWYDGGNHEQVRGDQDAMVGISRMALPNFTRSGGFYFTDNQGKYVTCDGELVTAERLAAEKRQGKFQPIASASTTATPAAASSSSNTTTTTASAVKRSAPEEDDDDDDDDVVVRAGKRRRSRVAQVEKEEEEEEEEVVEAEVNEDWGWAWRGVLEGENDGGVEEKEVEEGEDATWQLRAALRR